jgi:UDPglucose 6-dehydrogenase
VAGLSRGRPPLFEPGLEDLVQAGLASGKLRFTHRIEDVRDAEIFWVAYDTPVDSEDRADIDVVIRSAMSAFPMLRDGTVVLVSAQLPVGTTRRLEESFARARAGSKVSFAYSPENLRLGTAIAAFTKPERIVVGVRNAEDRNRLEPLFRPFSERVEWMGVESAEMTKHAINAFLATSVAFINEIAGLCETVGADAREVERGLKSEARIGPRARLKPGAAFAGGTLARDISFLEAIGRQVGRPTALVSAVRNSNDSHKEWPLRRLVEVLGGIEGKKIAVLGLTYKPGTDTLRRSSAIELCGWLSERGANVIAFDPAITDPAMLQPIGIELGKSVEETLRGVSAAVIATEWPQFREIPASVFGEAMAAPRAVLDANGMLEGSLGTDARVRYLTVGRSI